MLYPDYVTALQGLLSIQDTNGLTNLTAMLPNIISYAELRIYRDPDLDFLATRTADTTQKTTFGNRQVPIPSQIIVVESVSIIMPAGAIPTTLGIVPTIFGVTRIPLIRASTEFLDALWPIESQVLTPAPYQTYWSIYDQQETGPASAIKIAPTPDGFYFCEFRGTFRPAPLSVVNQSTFLTTNLPDLFLAASMVFGAGYQRDFGAQSDDPKLAQSWENQYTLLKRGAAVEEARKKAQSTDWSAMAPTTVAAPARAVA
jgi:hypothetical protein